MDFEWIPADPHVGGKLAVRRSGLVLRLRQRPGNSDVDNLISFIHDSAAAGWHEARPERRRSARIEPALERLQELLPPLVGKL
jgi:hypothetical protein